MAKIFDAAIEYKTNNSRAVSSLNSNSMNKAFKIDREGNLWAAFYVTDQNVNLYYSENGGFTWNWVSNIVAFSREDSSIRGDILYLMKSEALEKIYICTSDGTWYELDSTNLKHDPSTDPDDEELRTLLCTHIVEYIPSTKEYITQQESFERGLYSLCGDPDSVMYQFYSKGGVLKCAEYSMVNSPRERFLDLYEIWPLEEVVSTTDCSARIDSVAQGPYCYISFINNSEKFYFAIYNKQTHLFANIDELVSSSYIGIDPSIAIDGDGVVLAAFGDVSGGNDDVTIKYRLSSNDGISFSSTASITKPAGSSTYFDNSTANPQIKLSLLGDAGGGFLVSAIFAYQGRPTLFIKTISAAGVEGDWQIVNSRTDVEVTGNQFFRPFYDRLPYFGNMSDLRCAFQVGAGNNVHGHDTVLTSVYQERLGTNAFPEDSSSGSYYVDPLASGTLRVDFRVFGSLTDYTDYYNENAVGDYTERYIDAFNKIGISVKVRGYEPITTATDTGRSAYDEPTTYTTKVLIDPKTYDFPAVADTSSVVTQYIERDIRKAFFKPDFFMNRNFIINDGGYVKRTVWTLSYMGNDYEISQIVPRLINNEICFYEANLYVVGPSNDPFRKLTLPSET